MILTHEAILAEIDAGRVVVEPFTRDQVGPASIDLHLGDEIRVLQGGPPVIEVNDEADYVAFSTVQNPTGRAVQAADLALQGQLLEALLAYPQTPPVEQLRPLPPAAA